MNILKYFKTNKELKKELADTKKKLDNFKNVCHTLMEKATPELVIEKILNRPVKWFDHTKQDTEGQIKYYTESQAILRSPVFKNEKQAFINDLINHIAIASKNHEHTMALRYSINGVQALWERFEKIRNPDGPSENSPKEPNSPL